MQAQNIKHTYQSEESRVVGLPGRRSQIAQQCREALRTSKLFYLLSLLLSLALSAAPAETSYLSGYNSREGGLEETTLAKRTGKLYTLLQIEGLRRPVPPRYVRVISFRAENKNSQIIKKGILFTVAAYKAKRVSLSGDFNNWGTRRMRRGKYGIFYTILPVREIEDGKKVLTYTYKFRIDGIWIRDPLNKNLKDDGLGGYASVFHLPEFDPNRRIHVRILKEAKLGQERLVEFAIYKPSAQNLSLVGDFNNWNPEMDPMQKGADGVFRLRKRFKPGVYLYKYVMDGRWILDTYNPETRYHPTIDELTSYLRVPERRISISKR